MSSIRSLKKEINNSIGEIIEDVYAWELSNPSADLKKSDLIMLRPHIGVSPFDYKKFIGKKIKRDIQKGEILKKNHF